MATNLHCISFANAHFLFSQAQIKLEAFGYAIADATKALELDPNYVKVSRYREIHPRTRKCGKTAHAGRGSVLTFDLF